MNKVCLSKMGWNLKTKGNLIWANIMKREYLSGRLGSGSFTAKPYDSYIWESIVDLLPKLDNLSYWEVEMVIH